MILRMSVMKRAPRPFLLATSLTAALVLVACGGASDDGTTDGATGAAADVDAAAASDEGAAVEVVAAFYPLEFLASRVGGERISLTGLTPPGAEAHDLELSPQALAGLTETDLVVALGGFQPAVDDALVDLDVPVVDMAEIADRPYEEGAGHSDEEEEAHADEEEGAHSEEEDAHSEDEHGDTDPHFWLDPTHMAEAAGLIADALSEADPAGADTYAANAEALTAELTALDEEAQAAFATCEVDTLVTAHDAFGYFGDRYGFEIRSINGLTPDQEPDAGTLAEISDFVADSDVRTVYTETLVSSEIADTVAAEAGVETAVLDPVEGLTDSSAGEDYLEVMRANIDAVRAGQACA
jgi:zinc transport system substrate-binding protein